MIDDPTSPLAALSAFYCAFNSKDLDALAQVWRDGDEPSMTNPVGALRRGWPDRTCVFVGREKATCESPSGRLALRIRTTRWFVRRDGGWRQLHHHGSIEEPALLADYQRVIFGAPIGTMQ